jgi:hypothetical protein
MYLHLQAAKLIGSPKFDLTTFSHKSSMLGLSAKSAFTLHYLNNMLSLQNFWNWKVRPYELYMACCSNVVVLCCVCMQL